jgi:hypothetical protein
LQAERVKYLGSDGGAMAQEVAGVAGWPEWGSKTLMRIG